MADFLTNPQDNDEILSRSSGSTLTKKLKWSVIKSTLKTYFDNLYALTGHTHTGYEPSNSNIQTHIRTTGNPHGTTVGDIGAEPANTNIQEHISDSNIHVTPEDKFNWDSKQPAMGTDDNYVTDVEKVALHSHSNKTALDNVSGTNTGDNATNIQYSGLASTKQDTLVSGNNIKTINGNSIVGFGDLTIAGAGGDVTGAVSSIDNRVVFFSGTSGKVIKDSGLTLSGSNTGDETATTIKSKLGISVLSGSNTGDQDLSGYSLTSHNHTGTYAPALGADDNYITDVEKAALHAHSNKIALDAVVGTNTGDNSFSTDIETDKLSTTRISAIKTFYDWVKSLLTASQIAFTPSGTVAATTVQTAIEELDAEKAAIQVYPISPTSDYYILTGTPASDSTIIQLAMNRNVAITGIFATEFPDSFISINFLIFEGLNNTSNLSKIQTVGLYATGLQFRYSLSLTEIDIDSITIANSALTITHCRNLITLRTNNLKYTNGGISIAQSPLLESIGFPNLVEIGNAGALTITPYYAPNSGLSTINSLTTISFPELEYISGGISITNIFAVSTFNFNKLKYIGGNVSIVGLNTPIDIKFPLLEVVVGDFSITSSGTNNVTNVELGSVVEDIYTLREITGNITITGVSNLTNASLALLLRNIAYMGTLEGTIPYRQHVITLKVAAGDRITSGADYTKIVTTNLNTITYV